jgi:ABC-type antimicrobial peptide transport system permease subunit
MALIDGRPFDARDGRVPSAPADASIDGLASRRTQEIGVRMALGAGAPAIIREVLSRGARDAIIGVAVGLVLAAALAQLLKGLLLGVSPFDPLTHMVVAAFLLTICLVPSLVPARRATTVDPLVALREE